MNSVCHTEHKEMNQYVTLHPHLVLGDLGLNSVIDVMGSMGVFTFGRECLRKSYEEIPTGEKKKKKYPTIQYADSFSSLFCNYKIKGENNDLSYRIHTQLLHN